MAVRPRPTDDVRKRIERLFLLITGCYLVLVGRLVYLQAIHGGFYREKADKVRAQNITLEGHRGAILDRDGKWLAVTTHKTALICDPTKIKDPAEAASLLSARLNLSEVDLRERMTPRSPATGEKPDRSVVLAEDLQPEQIEGFQNLRLSRNGNLFAPFTLRDHTERAYPTGRDTVHLVGYPILDAQETMRGACGLEQSLDPILQGTKGYIKAEADAYRRQIPDTLKDSQAARDGCDVRVTIDATVQHILYQELANAMQIYQPVAATGIVLDPKTGDILAMVSLPDYDPDNRPDIRTNPAPFVNRAMSLYEPGSTMKILTVGAALQEKVITEHSGFDCSGKILIDKRTVSCASHGGGTHGHGSLDPKGVIQKSCNVSTAQIGMLLRFDRMEKWLRLSGLLDKSGIGLKNDTGGIVGFGRERENHSKAKAARMAFGQSVSVTPLGMVCVYAAIANDGMLVKPRLVQAYQDASGKVLQQFAPQPGHRLFTPEVNAELRSYLRAVVTGGTGKAAAIPGYTVAGKTGTAQKVDENKHGYASGKYVASFIGMVPASEPRAVICIVLDTPKDAHQGGQVAAPVFQAVGKRLMWYWKVPPDEAAPNA